MIYLSEFNIKNKNYKIKKVTNKIILMYLNDIPLFNMIDNFPKNEYVFNKYTIQHSLIFDSIDCEYKSFSFIDQSFYKFIDDIIDVKIKKMKEIINKIEHL